MIFFCDSELKKNDQEEDKNTDFYVQSWKIVSKKFTVKFFHQVSLKII